jgi:LacI family transcriptional regulator
VTQADVARLAGVSTTVVSYVLNNGPRPVATATRQRVRAAMARLGYRPDAGARGLRTRRPDVLGLVVPDIGNPFYADLTRELELAARARGYALVLCNALRDQATERTHVDVLLEHRVAGVFLGGTRLPPAAWQELSQRGVPLVFVNSSPRPGFTTIGSDGARCMHALVTHLIEAHGHRRIAFIGPPTGTSARRAGYLSALEAAGIQPDPRWTADVGNDAAAGSRALAAMLDRLPAAQQPTAVVAYNDLLAIGALRCAAERGRRVPDDLAVAGYDGIPLGAFVTPSLTTATHDLRAVAEAALDALPFGDRGDGDGATAGVATHVQASGAGGRHVVIPARLLLRESCGCPTRAAQTETSRREEVHA